MVSDSEEVVFVLISIGVCSFVLLFVVLAIASIFYRVFTLRKRRQKLFPEHKCDVATVECNHKNLQRTPSPFPLDTSRGFVSADSPRLSISPSISESRRPSFNCRSAETERQLLGVGDLPRDIVTELEQRDAKRRAVGPPPPAFK